MSNNNKKLSDNLVSSYGKLSTGELKATVSKQPTLHAVEPTLQAIVEDQGTLTGVLADVPTLEAVSGQDSIYEFAGSTPTLQAVVEDQGTLTGVLADAPTLQAVSEEQGTLSGVLADVPTLEAVSGQDGVYEAVGTTITAVAKGKDATAKKIKVEGAIDETVEAKGGLYRLADGTLSNPVSVSNNSIIRLNNSQLASNQKKFEQIADEIVTAWKDIVNNQVPALQASWAGTDAQTYIDQVLAYDSKVNAAVDILKLLSRTYGSASAELMETQQRIITTIKKNN